MILTKLTCSVRKNLKLLFRVLPFVVIPLLGLNSCSTSNCLICKQDKTKVYNVVLSEDASREHNKKVIQTYLEPKTTRVSKKNVVANVFEHSGKIPPAEMKKCQQLLYFRKNLIQLDTADVIRITTTSDADNALLTKRLTPLSGCERFRPFKIEARAMMGVRTQTEKSIFYPGIDGGTTYDRKFIGFGTGGTTLVLGPEIALLPRIKTFKNRHSLNLGLFTGFWPVDGGSYLPLSIHPRFTLNDIPNPLLGGCNTLYFFGDLGTAWDLSGKTDFIYDGKLTSDWWGVGLGTDRWFAKWFDLSLDLGYRFTSLSLPPVQDLSDCLNSTEVEVPLNSVYPVRSVGMFFVRFGITL